MLKKVIIVTSICFIASSYAAVSSSENSLATSASNSPAASNANINSAFQAFQNEYNIGYGYSTGTLINGAQNTATYTTQSINVELEHLFDIGVWFDVNFNMLTSNNQPNLGPLNGGNGSYTGNPAYNN